MPKGPKTTTVNTAPAYTAPPTTAATTALQGMVKGTTDPTIPYQYAQARENYENTWSNPLGSATSAATRENAKRAADTSFQQGEAQDLATSHANAENSAFGRQATVAGFTQPQAYATGGTNTTTVPWGQYLMQGLSAGAQVGSAALM